VAEKSPTKTKPAIAKNASAASSLALKALTQVGEMHQNKNSFKPSKKINAELKKKLCYPTRI
jgi:hypothetical protein